MISVNKDEYVRSRVLRPYLKRIISSYSNFSGCSLERAEEYIYDSNPNIRHLRDKIIENYYSFEKSIENKNNLIPLTNELHFNTGLVLLLQTNNNQHVIYDKNRADSNIYYKYIKWYSELLSINLNPRQPVKSTSNFAYTRDYIEDEPITDVAKASYLSGCLLAACQVLSVTDIHEHNIVYCNNIPIIIDDECICQPVRDSQIQNITRKDYYLSTYRSLLLYDPCLTSSLASTCGFSKLFQYGVSSENFITGYTDGMLVLRKHSKSLIELLSTIYEENKWVRYLLRSTSFYDYLKEYILLGYTKGKTESEVLKSLYKLFKEENLLFPELSNCIENELQHLSNFSTPYYLLHTKTGDIYDKKGGNKILQIESPKSWVQHTMPIIMARDMNKNILEIKESLKYWENRT